MKKSALLCMVLGLALLLSACAAPAALPELERKPAPETIPILGVEGKQAGEMDFSYAFYPGTWDLNDGAPEFQEEALIRLGPGIPQAPSAWDGGDYIAFLMAPEEEKRGIEGSVEPVLDYPAERGEHALHYQTKELTLTEDKAGRICLELAAAGSYDLTEILGEAFPAPGGDIGPEKRGICHASLLGEELLLVFRGQNDRGVQLFYAVLDLEANTLTWSKATSPDETLLDSGYFDGRGLYFDDMDLLYYYDLREGTVHSLESEMERAIAGIPGAVRWDEMGFLPMAQVGGWEGAAVIRCPVTDGEGLYHQLFILFCGGALYRTLDFQSGNCTVYTAEGDMLWSGQIPFETLDFPCLMDSLA